PKCHIIGSGPAQRNSECRKRFGRLGPAHRGVEEELALRLTHIPAEVADGVSFRAHEGDTGVAMRKARHHDRHARASDRHLELITGSKRRARLAKEQAAIVAEAFAPGANVSKIRRYHGLLFGW